MLFPQKSLDKTPLPEGPAVLVPTGSLWPWYLDGQAGFPLPLETQRLCPTRPLSPSTLISVPLQALHEVHAVQRQPWHQAPHPGAVPDPPAAEGGVHPAPEGPAEGHAGPAPGPVSGGPWWGAAVQSLGGRSGWGLLSGPNPTPPGPPLCCFLTTSGGFGGQVQSSVPSEGLSGLHSRQCSPHCSLAAPSSHFSSPDSFLPGR